MKKEIADKWVAALRSGEYEQGTEALHAFETHLVHDRTRKRGFCCLGVLCEVAIKEGAPVEKSISAYDSRTERYNGENCVLPREVMDWSGIKSPTGDIDMPADKDDICLTDINDTGKTFAEIADIIEQHWERL